MNEKITIFTIKIKESVLKKIDKKRIQLIKKFNKNFTYEEIISKIVNDHFNM